MIARAHVVVMVCAGLASCAPPPPPPAPRAPVDAVVVVEVPSLDEAAVLMKTAVQAGIAPAALSGVSAAGLAAAGLRGPVVVAARPAGGVVVAAGVADRARLELAIAAAAAERGLPKTPLVGDTVAVGDTLVRAGDGAMFIIVGAVDALAEAALLEGLASGAVPTLPSLVDGPGVRVLVPAPRAPESGLAGAVRSALGALRGGLAVEGRTVTLTLSSTTASAEVRAALAAPAAPGACALDDGAAVVVHVPPLTAPAALTALSPDAADVAGQLDAFGSRLAIAVRPQPSTVAVKDGDLASIAALAIAGVPRPGARADLIASLEGAIGPTGVAAMQTKTVGERPVRHLPMPNRPWRDLSVIAEDDLFALGIGAAVPIDRLAVAAPCPPSTSTALIRLDGPKTAALIERGRPDLAALRRAAALVGADDPLALLLAVERASIDASAAATGLSLTTTVTLRAAVTP